MSEVKKPVSLIQALSTMNEEESNQKIFSFSFLKEESMKNERHQIIRSALGFSKEYQAALLAVYQNSPELREFRVVNWVSLELGVNPNKTPAPIPIIPEHEKTLKKNKKSLNVENIFKLLADDYAETPEEKEALKSMLKKVKENK